MLAEDAVDRVRIGGLLHDVGKVGVSETVLNKPDPLDDRDWREIRRHPLIAARILDSSAVDDIRGWVLAHHERVDGLGYPNGLSGDEIPLESRILAVADAYEAMTSERVYRTALEPAEALAELERGSGSQFDPRVVGAFMRVLDRLGVRPASW
jgi:HD-GYP domain-containing protein (c-di-GMP phosphodiesterase class II)